MPITFTVNTLHKKKKGVSAEQLGDEIEDAFDDVVGGFVVTSAKNALDNANATKLYIAAIFFQRVVSRTPLDENYTWTENGKERKHKKDDDATRDHWWIAYGKKKLCAKDFPGCFDVFDDENSINTLWRAFQNAFATEKQMRTIRVYNDADPDKFNTLEYGKFKQASSVTKDGELYKHGVTNHFSIQAPVGMLRYTEGELGFILETTLKRKSAILARASKPTQKVPDKNTVKKIFRRLKKQGRITEEELGAIK